MLAWSPILIQRLDLHTPDLVLRKLQLNRHRDTEVAEHTHAFAQLILYLDGTGTQVIRSARHAARAGDLFLVPGDVPHGFAMAGHSRPLCLVLDFEETQPRRRVQHRVLRPAQLAELHGLLSRVPTKGRPKLSDYPAILAVAARLLEPPRDDAPPPPVTTLSAVQAALATTSGSQPGAIAKATGYHRDTLTRKLKRETGLGLRALRDQQRLAAAERALASHARIAEAAAAAGFEDPNYFARWFRRKTGRAPSAWRQSGGGAAVGRGQKTEDRG